MLVTMRRYEAFFDHPPEAAQYAARGAAALEALTPAPSLAKTASGNLQLTVIPLADSPGGTARRALAPGPCTLVPDFEPSKPSHQGLSTSPGEVT